MYQKITQYLQDDEFINPWPDLMQFVIRIINDKPKHILIPGLIAAAYDGVIEKQVMANASLTLLFSAIISVDSILDGDEVGPTAGHSCGELANTSLGLAGWAAHVLRRLSEASHQYKDGIETISRVLYQVSFGQALDASNPETEEAYWQLAVMKSGAFFFGAFSLGGLVGGASAADLTRLSALGQYYGVMLQLHDDLRDALEAPANSDWLNGRYTLPILYAHLVDHPERERFDAIRLQVTDSLKLEEAQSILIRSGALSYGLYQIQMLDEQVAMELEGLSTINDGEIRRMFAELVRPVEQLLDVVAV
ncbi:polyprenyl synthetase family protein [Chloroflexota bacterium]|nr:polyprenyl synthetase family protein [Chloroflexota bacterium]